MLTITITLTDMGMTTTTMGTDTLITMGTLILTTHMSPTQRTLQM